MRLIAAVAALALTTVSVGAQGARPWTFMDQQLLRQVGGTDLSPDGRYMLYTLSVPDWKEARRFTDIYVVSTSEGPSSAKRLTFTSKKNENNPTWSRDGRFFVFSSNRDTPNNGSAQQLYVMRPDGGEALRITDIKDGVGQYEFSRDGRWLVFGAGKRDEQQLWALPVAGIDTAQAVQITRHATPIGNWELSWDGTRAFFVSPDSVDRDEKARRESDFTVNIRNAPAPAQSLWTVEIGSRQERRLTNDASYSVNNFTPSRDGKWVGFSAIKNDRYARNITEQGINGDMYLLDVERGSVERLTNNVDIGEGGFSFSPNGEWIAFTAPNGFTYFRDNKLYVRRRADTGGQFRMLGAGYDGDVGAGWWSEDGRKVYFNDGVRATMQLLEVDIESDRVRQVTDYKAVVNSQRDEDSGKILINYADPKTPSQLYMVNTAEEVANRSSWKQLTDPNPQVRSYTLGDAEEITWKSRDGRSVGGVLLKPVGFQPGRRYPLIVAIHGGPAGADVLGFNGGYGSQAYANQGYVVLMPNYRGSTNYGEKHKLDIVGDYFKKGYEDIMTGVDYLIAQGMVHPDSMGALGWSAGGHWSNWILTHTDRFKAISSGAGTSNWISMYAQSDVQRNRQNYLGGKLPYDDHEAYWNQSPLKYIRNARTPTMIHVVDGDPRVPRPQSDELHMALKKLGVPTEYFVYPGSTHGIPDPRNQLTKSVAEMAWMEKWIRGKGDFKWKDVLKTLEENAGQKAVTTSPDSDY